MAEWKKYHRFGTRKFSHTKSRTIKADFLDEIAKQFEVTSVKIK
jgi:hypothetical protein